MTVKFRPADLRDIGEGSDRVFVVANWVASWRTAHAAGITPMKDYHSRTWADCEHYIGRSYVETLIAEEDGTLYGFLVYEPGRPRASRAEWRPNSNGELDRLPYVYYAYTKEAWRKGRRMLGTGVMTGLLHFAEIDPRRDFGFLCKTPPVTQLMDAGKIPGARWDPLRARYEREVPR